MHQLSSTVRDTSYLLYCTIQGIRLRYATCKNRCEVSEHQVRLSSLDLCYCTQLYPRVSIRLIVSFCALTTAPAVTWFTLPPHMLCTITAFLTCCQVICAWPRQMLFANERSWGPAMTPWLDWHARENSEVLSSHYSHKHASTLKRHTRYTVGPKSTDTVEKTSHTPS